MTVTSPDRLVNYVFDHRLGMTRRTAFAIGLASAAGLTIAGCSSDPTPSPTPTPTITETVTSSPTSTPSPTKTSDITTYKVSSGGTVKVAGDSTKYKASGGTMDVDPSKGSGTGVLAASTNVAATSTTSGAPSAWELNLVTNGQGVVQSGSLTSAGSEYKVTEPSGKINFLSTGAGTTLQTTTPIKVQRGTETPTTMTVDITGVRQ